MNEPSHASSDARSQPVDISTGAWSAVSSTKPGTMKREPKSYVPTLALANLGVYTALLTPVLVSLALKVQALVGLDNANAALSAVLAVGAIFALFANPIAGRFSDRTTSRFGMRRPWIIGGSIAGFLSFVLVATAPSIPVLVIGWSLAQVSFNSVLAAINASLADQVSPDRRGLPSGVVGVGAPLAILLGSLIVTLFSTDIGRFLVPAGLGLVFALVFALFLRDRRLTGRPGPFGIRAFFGTFVFNPVKYPDFGWVWITKFLFMFGYIGVNTFLAYYLITKFDIDPKDVPGTILLVNVFNIGATVLTSVLGGIISDRIGKRRPLLLTSAIVMGAGLVVLAVATSIPVVIVSQILIGLGAGTFFAVDLALSTQVLPNPEDNAKDLGVLNIAGTLPQSIAPALAVPIFSLGTALGIGDYTAWYLVGAVLVFLGGILIYRVKAVR